MAIVLDGLQNRFFQLCASGWLDTLIEKANTLDANYRAITNPIQVLAPWLKVECISSLGAVYPDNVYNYMVSKVTGYNYGVVGVPAENEAPANPNVDQDPVYKIWCNEHATKTPALLELVSGVFIDTEIVPNQASGMEIFSGVSAGTYVLAYDADSFCTEELIML